MAATPHSSALSGWLPGRSYSDCAPFHTVLVPWQRIFVYSENKDKNTACTAKVTNRCMRGRQGQAEKNGRKAIISNVQCEENSLLAAGATREGMQRTY